MFKEPEKGWKMEIETKTLHNCSTDSEALFI